MTLGGSDGSSLKFAEFYKSLVDDVCWRVQTANSLCFISHLLATNPAALGRLHEEIQVVLGARQTITADDLAKLHYTKCVIKEALRSLLVLPTLRLTYLPGRIAAVASLHCAPLPPPKKNTKHSHNLWS